MTRIIIGLDGVVARARTAADDGRERRTGAIRSNGHDHKRAPRCAHNSDTITRLDANRATCLLE